MDKIHQNYPLEKFLKDVKRHSKTKDNNLKALERLSISFEYFLKDKKHQNYPLEKFLKDKINHNYPLEKFLKDVKRAF